MANLSFFSFAMYEQAENIQNALINEMRKQGRRKIILDKAECSPIRAHFLNDYSYEIRGIRIATNGKELEILIGDSYTYMDDCEEGDWLKLFGCGEILSVFTAFEIAENIDQYL